MGNFVNSIDQTIYQSLMRFSLAHSLFLHATRIAAVYLVYFVPVILVVFWFYGPRERVVALRAFFAGAFGWLVINNIIGHFFFRARPSLVAAQELLFHRPDKAFPSDHATFGFALAVSFWLAGYKKLAIGMFVLTLVFTFGRVATGLHYASDVVGGFVVGLVVSYVFFLLRKPIDRYISEPLIKLARLFRLA